MAILASSTTVAAVLSLSTRASGHSPGLASPHQGPATTLRCIGVCNAAASDAPCVAINPQRSAVVQEIVKLVGDLQPSVMLGPNT